MPELPENSKRGKSMREFDYFREEAFFEPANQSDVLQLRADRTKRNLGIHGVMIVVVTVALSFLAAGFRDVFLYHWQGAAQVDLGKAEEMEGKSWPVGQYVKIRGITENRGATAHFMRGMHAPQDYWYVHLLGSPLIVELPAAEVKGKVEPFETITVEGRLLDLGRSRDYAKLAGFLQNSLLLNLPEHAYLLQGNVRPTESGRYMGLFAVLAFIPLANIALWLRTRRKLAAVLSELRAFSS